MTPSLSGAQGCITTAQPAEPCLRSPGGYPRLRVESAFSRDQGAALGMEIFSTELAPGRVVLSWHNLVSISKPSVKTVAESHRPLYPLYLVQPLDVQTVPCYTS